MPNTVVVRKLLEGGRSAIFSVFIASDGKSGDLTAQTVINPNVDFVPSLGKGMKLNIEKIWFATAGFDVLLSFDSLVDQPVWIIPSGTVAGFIDFSEFGGLQDYSGIDATGKLVVSTQGLSSPSDQGTLIIKVTKSPKTFSNP